MDFSTIGTSALKSLTSVFTTIFNAFSKRKLFQLQKKDARQKQVSDYLLNTSTAHINQLDNTLRQYISVVQRTKDQLRVFIYTSHNMSKKRKAATLHLLREELINCYSASRSYFDSTPYGGHAHLVKSGLLNIILELESSCEYDPENLLEAINLVTSDQDQLCKGLARSVHQMRQSLEQAHL
ncbi:hypothetical protein [Chitinophaga sp. HK235]|uniref:hypothetical protein n=1 Tax=Chitinophaga sp. HK235 TaxID=2952571 RepID=UPI001BA7FBA1|nr:hypothetical protein [Chitinophaga sp. HK235]